MWAPRSHSWRALGEDSNDANAVARVCEPVAPARYMFPACTDRGGSAAGEGQHERHQGQSEEKGDAARASKAARTKGRRATKMEGTQTTEGGAREEAAVET